MSWKEQLTPTSPTWVGVEMYAEERIAEMMAVCASPAASDMAIRQAQACIGELRRLIDLPNLIRAEAQVRIATSVRRENY
ncbi:MAG: hypothetical protein CGW95_12240 [Phenylobacterium zucineum]|nr:MAG: hypothetical protein CGW95_12240 [Phenylobacterium zucineum]